MSKKVYLGIALAMSMASCTNEDYTDFNVESKLEATVENTAISRVGFDKESQWSFFWHNGDRIWVNESPMKTEDADKSKTATFTGYGVNTSSGYAIYPFNGAEDNVNNNVLTWNFPTTYSYDDIDNEFFKSSQDVPMYAEVENGSASFKHLSAVAVFKVNGWELVGEHVFTLTTSKKITGEFTADLTADVPEFTTTEEVTDQVTIEYNRPENAGTGDIVFYVPVPTGTYDISFKLKVNGQTELAKSYKGINVKRADVVWAEFGESTLVGGSVASSVANLDELKSAISVGGNITLAADITGISELLKVEKDLILDLNGHTLAFTPQTGYPAIKNTAKLEVMNSKTGGKFTSTQVGIQNNGTLVINCDLEAGAGNAINNVYDGETTINGGTYKNTSTDKALINSDNFGEGTPVLTINGGSFESVFTNVSYNNASTGSVNAGTFKCTGGWHNIYIGGSEGGCNVNYDETNCTFESNGINIQVNNWGVETNKNTLNNVEYTGVHNIVYASTIASLQTAVGFGGEVSLTADITGVSELLKVEKDLLLDLNGHTLAFTPQTGYPAIKNTAKLEVKNSKTGGKFTSTQVGIQNNGTLVINCDLEAGAGNAINNVYDGETTINGGTYKNTSTDKALINSDNFGEGTPVLTINGGSFESVFTNVSYNNASTGSVNAGTFKCTGGWHNIYIGGSEGGCNVNYDETNCTFESNGINIQVNNWGVETNKNTLNNVEYTGVHNIVYASTIASLQTAVGFGGEVSLTADITGVSELLKVEKDLVLDLNGHTLAFTPQTGYPAIKNTAKLEVMNSKTGGKFTSTQVGIQNNGTLVINCDLEAGAGNAINNVYDGETTINGGTYKNTSTDKALINSDNFGEGTPVLTINGGSFESVFTNVSYNNASTGSVNAGTFKCTGGWHNIYVGGSEGGCNVNYDETNCTFESNGINIQVNDWGKSNTNTVNNQTYTSTTTLME